MFSHKTLASFYAAQDKFYAAHGHLIVGDETDEFSASRCDCCASQLAGTRYSALTLKPRPRARKPPYMVTAWKGKICTDCVFFHANGDAPDLPEDEGAAADAGR